jgi:GDSL-like Lipase/Acylhydrolase family
MTHVALLGDSIFDNEVYVEDGEPAVIAQLREELPPGSVATLCAVDGDTVRDIANQLSDLPESASHLVVSVGGNNALQQQGILAKRTASVGEALGLLAEMQTAFQREYECMLDLLVAPRKPLLLCTIYDHPSVSAWTMHPDAARIVAAALSLYNDVILREAAERHLPVLDLRQVCNAAQDYSRKSPIEPSAIGGAKIARAIARIVSRHDFGRGEAVIFGRSILDALA